MTPEADTAGFTPSACAACADAAIREKASSAAEQICVKQFDIGISLKSDALMRGATLAARWCELKCRCGIGSMARSYEPRGEQGGQRQRQSDADHASGPAQAVDRLAQHRAAQKSAEEVAREIEAACRTAIDGGGAADEAGGRRLGEECADSDQGKAQQQGGEARAQHQRQAGKGNGKGGPQCRPRAEARNRSAGEGSRDDRRQED